VVVWAWAEVAARLATAKAASKNTFFIRIG
jgi:hypothetical protein